MKTVKPFTLFLLLSLSFFATPQLFAITIDCNNDISASIDVNGEVDEYTFTANQGDIAFIRMNGNYILFRAKIELYGPDNNLIVSVEEFINPAHTGLITLPQSGVYTIKAMEKSGNQTGEYGISLQLLTPECAIPIGCSENYTGNIATLAGMEALTFTLEETTPILLRQETSNFSFQNKVFLYNQAGDLIFEGGNFGDPIESDVLTLAPDVYYALVAENKGDDISQFDFMIQYLTADCSAEAGICNSNFSGSLDEIELQAFHFSATEGTTVFADVKNISGDTKRIILYDETGNELDHGGTFTNPRLEYKFPVTGHYFLVVKNLADYTLSIRSIETSCSDLFECSQDTLKIISNNAGLELYHFWGDVGDQFVIMERGYDGAFVQLEVYNPSKELIAEDSDFPRRVNLTIAESGFHYILAPYIGDGSYGLAIRSLSVDCTDASLDCTAPIMNSLDHEISIHSYAVPVQAGETQIIRVGDADNDDWLYRAELYTQDGELIAQSIDNDTIDFVYTAATDESLILLALDEGSTQLGSFNITTKPIGRINECTETISCGETLAGTFSYQNEIDAWVFEGEAGTNIDIVAYSQSLNLFCQLKLFSPDGVLLTEGEMPFSNVKIEDFELPQTGLYTLMIFEKEGDNLGDYNLSVDKTVSTVETIEADLFNFKNAPNPATEQTYFSFELNAPALVELSIFDLLGNRIETLSNDLLSAETHHIGYRTQNLTAGIYVAKLVVNQLEQQHLFSVIK